MIIIKHAKLGNMVFVSHVDCMRVLQRSLVRAGIKTMKSIGFNPHQMTYCSPPLPVGVASVAEYLTYSEAEKLPLVTIREAFEKASPDGIKVLAVMEVATNPNIAGKVVASEYSAPCELDKEATDRVLAFVKNKPNVVTFTKQGADKELDIAPLIHGFTIQNGTIFMRLATGNPTLRPDKMVEILNKYCSLDGQKIKVTDVVRVRHFIEENGQLIDVDEWLKRFLV